MKRTTRKPQESSLPEAFLHAGQGVACAFAKGRNFKIEAAVAVIAVILGFMFSVTPGEWLAIVICIGAVLASECVNTAMEAVVDKASPEYSELARVAKDCAAGAVLILSICSLVVAAVVFLPHILGLSA